MTSELHTKFQTLCLVSEAWICCWLEQGPCNETMKRRRDSSFLDQKINSLVLHVEIGTHLVVGPKYFGLKCENALNRIQFHHGPRKKRCLQVMVLQLCKMSQILWIFFSKAHNPTVFVSVWIFLKKQDLKYF